MARKYGLLILIGFLGAALLASEVQAQPQGGGRGGRGMGGMGPGGGGGMMLLTLVQNDKVQKELEIVADQKTKLTALATEQSTAMRDLFASMQDLSPEERQTKMQKNQDELMKKLGEILLPKQLERLKEIQLQAEGAMALLTPDVSKALKITEDQQVKMREAQSSMRDAMSGLRDLSREERQTKMTALRKEISDKMLAVLTPDQVAQYEKMKGAKVDIDFSTLMGPGGRGGRGGPGGGGPPPGGPGGN
jgi:delta 1-pyrroline-5-carboxylate dehydrogenase